MKLLIPLFILFFAVNATAQSDPDNTYNTACRYALANKPDSAFQCLDSIIGITYFKYAQLTKDSDLITLHPDVRWEPLLNRIRQAKVSPIKRTALYQDFDRMVKALKEAHTGLYWYNTPAAFDSICRQQRKKILAEMTPIQFYQVVAPVIAFTKEGHTFLRLGGQAQAYVQFSGQFFPYYLKFINKEAYILNKGDLEGYKLTKINGEPLSSIMEKFLSYEPADGYNTTSKYRWIEENAKFSRYYAYTHPWTSHFTIEANGRTLHNIPAVSYETLLRDNPEKGDVPAKMTLQAGNTALLTINTFSKSRYKAAGMDFHEFIRQSFEEITSKKIGNLIIDIRKNGGGTEGYEDYLLSFLIKKDYQKYTYVQASAFSYSFYPYTDYASDWQELEAMLREEHARQPDGRILRKPGVEPHTLPQHAPYTGKIYVLTSGLTYSGGAEFAALVKDHTNAVFVGEEVGGGYYGNTSGNRIVLKLPNSKLEIGIPLLKFVVNTADSSVPVGHGVLPDYPVQPDIHQYLLKEDVELLKVMDLITQPSSK